jgi:hypothetical protein
LFNTKGANSKHELITKEFVLSRVSEEDIFRHYLGVSVEFNKLICSPLREDHRPTVSFREVEGVILMNDFSGHFKGDCFEVVMFQRNCDFPSAVRQVAYDFGLTKETPVIFDVQRQMNERKERAKKSKKRIAIKRRKWNEIDQSYWGQFSLGEEDLNKFHASPVDVVWIDGEERYRYKPKDPGYAYYFGNGNFKIYFPLRDNFRFLSNGSFIQGWNEIDLSSDLIIITKSLKDVMVLNKLGFSAWAPHSEGALIREEDINFFNNHNQVIFFDNDEPGIEWAKNNSEKYSLPYIYLKGDDKDVSDLVKNTSLDYAKESIIKLLNNKSYVKNNQCIHKRNRSNENLRELRVHDLGRAKASTSRGWLMGGQPGGSE